MDKIKTSGSSQKDPDSLKNNIEEFLNTLHKLARGIIKLPKRKRDDGTEFYAIDNDTHKKMVAPLFQACQGCGTKVLSWRQGVKPAISNKINNSLQTVSSLKSSLESKSAPLTTDIQLYHAYDGIRSELDYTVGDWHLEEPDTGGGEIYDYYCGPDFRSLRWGKKKYAFTPNQARAVQILFEAWKNGAPNVGQAYILEKLESAQGRLYDVFKDNRKVWEELIISEEKGTGTYRLIDPPRKQ